MVKLPPPPQLSPVIEQAIAEAIRELLERKHLYQRHGLDDPLRYALAKALVAAKYPETPALKAAWDALIRLPWHLQGELETRAPYGPSLKERERLVIVPLPRTKLFCTSCQRVEAFASLRGLDLVAQSYTPAERPAFTDTQLFALTYLCQSCTSLPEAFLVHRVGTRLSIHGRSPMEHVSVPYAIPKAVRPYFAGAVVAFQSGQTLAGLFMQRTLIEQFARSLAPGTKANADALMDAYQALLPTDFKSRFPSLPDLYTRISGALHTADADDKLFHSSQAALLEHFEARRLFKLDGSAT